MRCIKPKTHFRSVHQERPNIAPELLQRTDELLQQCSAYYMVRVAIQQAGQCHTAGWAMTSSYLSRLEESTSRAAIKIFDRHGRGFVTQSQVTSTTPSLSSILFPRFSFIAASPVLLRSARETLLCWLIATVIPPLGCTTTSPFIMTCAGWARVRATLALSNKLVSQYL